MKYIMVRRLLIICILFTLGLQAEACSTVDDSGGIMSLTVCIDSPRTPFDNAYKQVVEEAAEYCSMINPDVHIDVQQIPNEAKGRRAAIEGISQEISEGKGPDIFLIDGDVYMHSLADVLFTNANEQMKEGVFADIEGYVSEDEELSLGDFNAAVVDAGIYDGKRYVLPITMTYATGLITDSQLEDIDENNLTKTFPEYIEEITGQTKPLNSDYHSYMNPILFSDNSDSYDFMADENVNLLKEYEEWVKAHDVNYGKIYEMGEEIPSPKPYNPGDSSVSIGMLDSDTLGKAAHAESMGEKLVDFPVPTSDGEYHALITDFIAISSSSSHIKEAYGFIRLFLTEDFQSGRGFTVKFGKSGETDVTFAEGGVTHFFDWPVRKTRDIESLYRNGYDFDENYPLTNGDFSPKTDLISIAHLISEKDMEAMRKTNELFINTEQ